MHSAVDLECPLERTAHSESDRALGEKHQPRQPRHPVDEAPDRVY